MVGLSEPLPDLMRVLLAAEDADHVEDAGLAHETLATLAWSEALNRYAIQLGLEPSAPGGG